MKVDMKNNIKVALYCRVAREDDTAIKIQEEMLRRFAEENNYTNLSIYTDNGFNGLNFNRPAFIQMDNDIEAGLIDTVIVKDLSRLSRNTINIFDWLDKIQSKGVSFKSVLDNFHTLKETNNTLFQAFNEYRTKHKMRNYIKNKKDNKKLYQGEF